ncbi:asparagine synthase (glutamine-hydrolyzing) [Polaribacter sp. KT 15]|uniref:asparagine synthase (glutamine-hydrolyzing) n=1 Tax=Polaribacter sp. KT 15 TaxID=1896175 RepID=UPI000909837D|nr:asparagine synthase (glutamine-hydrolyzing) [Polaribacter sp. KT 15]SHN09675.1 asparagine synthase (glutamine-hydrolysing) [Polaribacter sp. KT 15]
MCGIAGIIGGNIKEDVISKMLKTQHHRGPDNTGVFRDEQVLLGHNRLSILDLSEKSNQPFKDNSNRYIITFNGEIYNYIELKEELKKYNFKTESDTEVLLAAYIKWGKKCLHKLNGMFSFAIWDKEKKHLFAARDRFGVKPFYYYREKEKFYFSSEIKALHASGVKKTPNKKVWASYLTYGSYGHPTETFWENINQLQGGHYLEYSKNSLNINKWYFFEKEILKYQAKVSFKSVKEKYKSLLEDSIKLRFRADVKVGFNISGGLDSSALLAYVNKLNNSKNINAYTFYTNDNRYDELPWVEEMINYTENPLSKILLKIDDDFYKLIDYISKIQEEPFGGIPTLAYSKIFDKARKDNVIVLLDGQGMDEQWAGYDYYLKNNDNTIQGIKSSPFKENVLAEDFKKFASKPVYPKPFKDAILNKQYRDLFYTKIPRALRFNDRVSMAFSTELREPFLDYRLVEYAFAQPLDYKIKNDIQKYLLRELVAEDLNDSISYAPKRPLQTPQREWLQNELFSFVKDSLEKIKKSEYSNWFNIKELEEELVKYKKGNIDSSFHIWQWVSLGLNIDNYLC